MKSTENCVYYLMAYLRSVSQHHSDDADGRTDAGA